MACVFLKHTTKSIFKNFGQIPRTHSLWQYGSDFEDNDNKFITGKTTEFNLTVNSTDGGSVNDANGSYEYLSVVELNASANDHKIFIGWLGDGVSDPTSDFTTISMTQDGMSQLYSTTNFTILLLIRMGMEVSPSTELR